MGPSLSFPTLKWSNVRVLDRRHDDCVYFVSTKGVEGFGKRFRGCAWRAQGWFLAFGIEVRRSQQAVFPVTNLGVLRRSRRLVVFEDYRSVVLFASLRSFRGSKDSYDNIRGDSLGFI
jgi:hypothetical protein